MRARNGFDGWQGVHAHRPEAGSIPAASIFFGGGFAVLVESIYQGEARINQMMIHPSADLFPLLDGEEFEALCADIRKFGLLEPIVVHEGKVLDGRNRLRACQAIGIEPRYVDWVPVNGMSPTEWVVSLNIHRRHLTPSQRAAVALRLLPELEREASERQGSHGAAPGRPANTCRNLATSVERSSEKAAKLVGASARYVEEAKKIATEAPELVDDLLRGATTIPRAKREVKERKRQDRRDENAQKVQEAASLDVAVSAGARFATIVIDPPWDWSDEGDVNQMGRARPDYHTIGLDDLRKLPVGDMADTDAHIYLWITNRSLPKGFDLLERWGFRYVTALTWVKPSFGLGNYFRGQTEHVLFGVRGSQPLLRKDQGTYFHAERGPRGHSSKPLAFYDLVESCSPGPYLEMFARGGRDGWVSWGEEGLSDAS